jgi:hypothetical protein
MARTIPTEVALSAAVQFEQTALRSKRDKTCAACGEQGMVTQGPTSYCHVVYFMCDECDSYWKSQRPSA